LVEEESFLLKDSRLEKQMGFQGSHSDCSKFTVKFSLSKPYIREIRKREKER
jgi:hypothetical protein